MSVQKDIDRLFEVDTPHKGSWANREAKRRAGDPIENADFAHLRKQQGSTTAADPRLRKPGHEMTTLHSIPAKPHRFEPLKNMGGGSKGNIGVKCKGCGDGGIWDQMADAGWQADLNGEPYKAYYCPTCVGARNRAPKTESTITEEEGGNPYGENQSQYKGWKIADYPGHGHNHWLAHRNGVRMRGKSLEELKKMIDLNNKDNPFREPKHEHYDPDYPEHFPDADEVHMVDGKPYRNYVRIPLSRDKGASAEMRSRPLPGEPGHWQTKERLKAKSESRITETGEPDQDYDHEFWDGIVAELKKAGFQAQHKEFDKYQGVYLRVSSPSKRWKFWRVDDYYTGQKQPKYPGQTGTDFQYVKGTETYHAILQDEKPDYVGPSSGGEDDEGKVEVTMGPGGKVDAEMLIGYLSTQEAPRRDRQESVTADIDRLFEHPLDAAARHRLPRKDFALPGGRYPVEDKAHARNALSRVSGNGSPEEKAAVKAKVCRKYPGLPSCKEAVDHLLDEDEDPGENLDGLPLETLRSHISSVKGAPASYLAYGREKLAAMKARLAGKIETARRHESNCDKMFDDIPAEWRW
jgi:hypothetical protein